MHKPTQTALLITLLSLLVLAAPPLFAQAPSQTLDDKIKQAQEEVQKLEAFAQASSTSASLRAGLQPLLDSRRAMLKDLEALRQLPVKVTDKEMGLLVSSLETNRGTASTSATPVTPSIADIRLAEAAHEGDTEVKVTGAKPETKVKVLRNGAEPNTTITTNTRGELIWSAPANQPLNAGERLSFKQEVAPDKFSGESEFFPVKSIDQKLDTRLGTAVGYLMGGIVLSQQAQEFKQSDPFLGFVAGYRFGAWRKRAGGFDLDVAGQKLDNENYVLIEEAADAKGEFSCVQDDPPCHVVKRLDGKTALIRKRDKKGQFIKSNEDFHNWGQLQLRFQGLFNSAPRAVQGTATPAANSVVDFKPFIASRKTFDVDLRLWYELPSFTTSFKIGPYGLVGASTVLSRTELDGEEGKVETMPGTGMNNTPPVVPCIFINSQAPTAANTLTPGTCTVQTDNDLKKYRELGLLTDVSLFNKQLYMQSTVGYGHYEMLKDLVPGGKHDSRNRFIGRLRLFPGGLNRDFGGQRTFAPMFGVEVNAGYGPDQVKFFIGSVIRLRGLTF